MVNPREDVVSAPAPKAQGTAETTLAELRESVRTIASEVATIIERRTRPARASAIESTEAGVVELRRAIRRQPVMAMAIAAAAGALLGLAIAPRSSGASSASHWDRWTPNVTRADLYELADNLQRSVSRAASLATAPVGQAFERVVDALSRVMPQR